jgi:hypothetical protein
VPKKLQEGVTFTSEPIWPFVMLQLNEWARKDPRSNRGKRTCGHQKQNKIHLCTIGVSQPELHKHPSPRTFQTTLEFRGHYQPSSVHILCAMFLQEKGWFSGRWPLCLSLCQC